MAVKKILFIEGEATVNGDPRIGFSELLGQKLDRKPKIVLGGGKPSTVKQFLKNKFGAESFLLMDLDKDETGRNDDIRENHLKEHETHVFYMIQEIESWFLSQPEVLDKYYGITTSGKKISEIISNRKCSDIENPKEELIRVTQTLNKGEKYHVIKHVADLLQRLDATKLENDFPDFKRLVEALRK